MKKSYYPIEGFPERLRQAIFDSGMATIVVARRAGLSKSTLYRYLDGDGTPNITTCAKLAMLLHVTLDYLVFGR